MVHCLVQYLSSRLMPGMKVVYQKPKCEIRPGFDASVIQRLHTGIYGKFWRII